MKLFANPSPYANEPDKDRQLQDYDQALLIKTKDADNYVIHDNIRHFRELLAQNKVFINTEFCFKDYAKNGYLVKEGIIRTSSIVSVKLRTISQLNALMEYDF